MNLIFPLNCFWLFVMINSWWILLVIIDYHDMRKKNKTTVICDIYYKTYSKKYLTLVMIADPSILIINKLMVAKVTSSY